MFGSRFVEVFPMSLTGPMTFIRQYGSGYPGTNTPGIAGRGFPFGFWPVTFGSAAGVGVASQFHSNEVRHAITAFPYRIINALFFIVWRPK